MRICLLILSVFLFVSCPLVPDSASSPTTADAFWVWYFPLGGSRVLFPCGFEGVNYIRIQPGQTINLTKGTTSFIGCSPALSWTVTATPAVGHHLRLHRFKCNDLSAPEVFVDNGTSNPASLTGSTQCTTEAGFMTSVQFLSNDPISGTLQMN